MREFKINQYITLRLERGRTNIYVNGKLFNHCKYVLLDIPLDNSAKFDQIESIDDAVENLDHSMEKRRTRIQMDPEAEFWGHISNLQAWAEYEYDTRLLHTNLAFPLLRELTIAGDPVAKRVFKEEIAKRVMSKNPRVIEYLCNVGYLSFLNVAELETILSFIQNHESLETNPALWRVIAKIHTLKKDLHNSLRAYQIYLQYYPKNYDGWLQIGLIHKQLVNYNIAIKAFQKALNFDLQRFINSKEVSSFTDNPYFLHLFLEGIKPVQKMLLLKILIRKNNLQNDRIISEVLRRHLKSLAVQFVSINANIYLVEENHLELSNQHIKDISQIKGLEKLPYLKSLSLYYNNIQNLSGLEQFTKLESLTISFNQLTEINGLESLRYLKKLDLKHNKITEISGLDKLTNLEYLNLPHNEIGEIKGLSKLKNLKQLILRFNKIGKIKGLNALTNLETLDLAHNSIKRIENLQNLPNLKEIYLCGNTITNLEAVKEIESLQYSDLFAFFR